MTGRYHDQSVYFAERADTGLIKIGCSSSPKYRIKQLISDLRVPIEILAEARSPKGFWDERRMHAEFADERVEGEWFSPSEAVLAAVEYVRKTGQLPPSTDEFRDAAIIRRRGEGETLQSIANAVGISRQRVCQILHDAEAEARRHAAKAAA